MRHEFEADVFRQRKAADEGRQGDQQGGLGPAQGPAQHRAIDAVGPLLRAVDDAGEASVAMSLRVVPDRGEHRVESEGHEQRDQDGGRDHDTELEEETADDAAHEGHGQEHRHDAEGRGEHGEADLVGAVDGGLTVRLAEADMAHDVLAHHDRIVDQDADGEAQRHQGQHIQGEAEGGHHHEGAEHRDRQGKAGDDGAAPGMQEQEDDGDREQAALDHSLLDVVDRVLDAARAVAHDLELDVLGQGGLQLGNGAADTAGHFDRIGPLRLHHVDGKRPLAVQHGHVLEFLLAVDHGGDLAEIDGGLAAAGDDQIGEVARIDDAARHLDDPVVVAALHVAGGEVLVLVLDRPHDVVHADAKRVHATGIEFDVDLALQAAGDGGAADVADCLQALDDDLVGKSREVAHRADIGAHGDRHDRLVVGVEPLDQRLLDVRPEGRPDHLDLLANVLHGHG